MHVSRGIDFAVWDISHAPVRAFDLLVDVWSLTRHRLGVIFAPWLFPVTKTTRSFLFLRRGASRRVHQITLASVSQTLFSRIKIVWDLQSECFCIHLCTCCHAHGFTFGSARSRCLGPQSTLKLFLLDLCDGRVDEFLITRLLWVGRHNGAALDVSLIRMSFFRRALFNCHDGFFLLFLVIYGSFIWLTRNRTWVLLRHELLMVNRHFIEADWVVVVVS